MVARGCKRHEPIHETFDDALSMIGDQEKKEKEMSGLGKNGVEELEKRKSETLDGQMCILRRELRNLVKAIAGHFGVKK